MIPQNEAIELARKLRKFCAGNSCAKCIFFNKPMSLCNINGTPEKWDCSNLSNLVSMIDFRR